MPAYFEKGDYNDNFEKGDYNDNNKWDEDIEGEKHKQSFRLQPRLLR